MATQLRSGPLKKMRRVSIFTLSSLVFFTGCASKSQNEDAAFEKLISQVESGEEKLEKGQATFNPKWAEFLNCINGNVRSLCKDDLQNLKNSFDGVAELWDFQSSIAELTSLRLTGNDEASLARDKFVKHLRVWKTYLDDLRFAAPTVADLDRGNQEWAQAWEDIMQENEITETFDEVCSALGNAQPEDSDVFKSRIIDICDD